MGGEGVAHVKFYPQENGGGGYGKSFSHAEGVRGTKSFEVVSTRELEVLAIVGHKKFPPFKSGDAKFCPVLRGGGRKKFQTRNFSIL